MADTQRLNTGRSSEFSDTGGGGNGLGLDFTEVTYTGGVEGFGAIADVTGVSMSFSLDVAGPVQFFASGASLANPFIQGNYLGLAINVNGTDYYLNGTGVQGFNAVGGGNLVTGGFTGGNAISGAKVLDLPAGSYTVKLRAFGNGYLESSATFPTRLAAVYPIITGDIAVAASLTSQQTGPFAGTVNPTGTEYHVVAGSTITVVLDAPQTIVMSAYAAFVDSGTNSCPGQLGIRVESGSNVTDYEGNQTTGGNDVNKACSTITRAVQLSAGTHTFDQIVRNPQSGAQFQYEGAFLTVVYNNPQEIAPAGATPITSQEAMNDSGVEFQINNLTTFQVIPSTHLDINLNGTQTVVFMGYATSRGDPAEDHIFGLRVDGVDYPGTSHDVAGTGEDNAVVVYRAVELGAGSHTADLVAKVSTAGNMFIRNNVDFPTVLTAIYTVPQAINPAPFAFMATAARTAGDVTGVSTTSLIDVPGPVEVTINTSVGGDVLIEVSGYANGGSGNHIIGLGLKIDGVEQSDTPSAQLIGISPMGCLGATVNGFVGFKWLATGLTAGSHTFRLTHAVDGGSSAALRATAQRPLRMFVWYN